MSDFDLRAVQDSVLLEHLRAHPGQDVVEIATALSLPPRSVSPVLWALHADEKVGRDADGKWSRLPDRPTRIIVQVPKASEMSWRGSKGSKKSRAPEPSKAVEPPEDEALEAEKEAPVEPAQSPYVSVVEAVKILGFKPAQSATAKVAMARAYGKGQLARVRAGKVDTWHRADLERLATKLEEEAARRSKPRPRPVRKPKTVVAPVLAPTDWSQMSNEERKAHREKLAAEQKAEMEKRKADRRDALTRMMDCVRDCVKEKALSIEDGFEIIALTVKKLRRA